MRFAQPKSKIYEGSDGNGALKFYGQWKITLLLSFFKKNSLFFQKKSIIL